MRRHPVGYRYAYAMYELAKEQNVLQETADELLAVSAAFDQANLVETVFSHPDLSDAEKKDVLKNAFTGKVSDHVLHLLYLLVDNGREAILSHVAENYRDLANEEQGIASAVVHSAKPLTDAEQEAVAETFAKRAGKARLMITNVVDEHLIGGLRVQIGDTVYDGTVANQLARIEKRMIHGNVSR